MIKQKVDEFEDSLDCMKIVNSINQLKLDMKKLRRQCIYNTPDNRPNPENNYIANENDMNDNEDKKIYNEESKTPYNNHYLSESQILAFKQTSQPCNK